jgi:hypothetical protein
MSFLDLYQGDQEQTAAIQPNEGTRLPSGFDENIKAAWSDGRLFNQSIARANARASVLDDYIDEIRQKTGNDLSKDFIPDAAGGGSTGVTDFDTANARVADLKAKFPDLDLSPISEDEINARAIAKAQAAHRDYEALQAGEKTAAGSFGSFLGSEASAAADPVNLVALAIAPETGGASILGSALRWGALAGVSQAAIEASSDDFKEQVQPGYVEGGGPVKEVVGAFVGGAVLGGTFKALGNAWTRVKTGAWPTSVRDAGNVIESEANVADTNPFPGAEGEVAHRDALIKTIDDILANRPIQIDHIITPDFLERSRALVDKLQTEQPMALPIINQRAFELIAEQERLTGRDKELSAHLETLGPGDPAASETLSRVQAIESQIESVASPEERRALSRRRDELLTDTTPEKLQAAAAPIEQRRVAEAERASIASRLDDITIEHANLQASTLPQMQLPALGQRERIPTGPKGQFELDLQPPPIPEIQLEPGEKIDRAAIKIGDKVYTGYSHTDALDRATKDIKITHEEFMAQLEGNDNVGLDGFVTTDGRYLTRKEAYAIQDAIEAKERARAAVQDEQPALQTADEMRETLTAPDHQDAIRADIDRERAMGDVQVPGIDENGNHTMLSVDKAMDEVDAYKQAAEQIQACANPVQEAAE